MRRDREREKLYRDAMSREMSWAVSPPLTVYCTRAVAKVVIDDSGEVGLVSGGRVLDFQPADVTIWIRVDGAWRLPRPDDLDGGYFADELGTVTLPCEKHGGGHLVDLERLDAEIVAALRDERLGIDTRDLGQR